MTFIEHVIHFFVKVSPCFRFGFLRITTDRTSAIKGVVTFFRKFIELPRKVDNVVYVDSYAHDTYYTTFSTKCQAKNGHFIKLIMDNVALIKAGMPAPKAIAFHPILNEGAAQV